MMHPEAGVNTHPHIALQTCKSRPNLFILCRTHDIAPFCYLWTVFIISHFQSFWLAGERSLSSP